MEILIESPDVIYQRVFYKWNAITQDPDDNMFFDIAVAGNADFIVTNDSHFDAINRLNFPSIKLISADEFLTLVTKLSPP